MWVSRRQGTARAVGLAAVSGLPEAGCANAPSISVLGAYFPDWLFCIVAGVVLTIAVYLVSARLPDSRRLGPAAVVYPTLVALLALLAWLIFFKQ